MSIPSSRIELKEWCLRRLGYPVIEINVADQQLEDLVDHALSYWNDWHYEGSERLYLKHQLHGSILKLNSAVPLSTFSKGDSIIGETSGTTAVIEKQNSDNISLEIWQTNGAFTAGENILLRGVPYQLSSAADMFVAGDLDNKYITVPDHIMSITKIFPISAVLTSNYMFNSSYFFLYDAIWNFNGLDLISYEMMKERINQIDQMFTGQKPIRFNRKTDKLYIDFDWTTAVVPGSFVVIDCWRALDPSDYSKVWGDYFLREYLSALFMIQWGENLSKFASIQLPGGVTLDGPRILEEGKTMKAKLEEETERGKWSAPLGFEIG